MMQQGIQMNPEILSCSICLDLLKDPVTIPCGHSYCMNCIGSHWDGEDQKETYSCPQCRETFRPRPDLRKSTVLADLVEEVKKTRRQSVPADLCYAGPGDVSCDFCTGRKLKAVKSCLQCLVSYCDQHLQPHYQSPAFKNHKLIDPFKKLQENICSAHNEVMKIFCRTDQQLICYLCSLDEHKGHDTVSAAAEKAKRLKKLRRCQKKIQQRIAEGEECMRRLIEDMENVNIFDEVLRYNEEMLKDLFSLMKRMSEVEQLISSKQNDEICRDKELLETMQQEIDKLRRKHFELLSNTDDLAEVLHVPLSDVSDWSENHHKLTNHL